MDKLIPPILYFPTFLFEIPSRIYLQPEPGETRTNAHYRNTMQDLLDSLDDGLTVQEHIVKRALGGSSVEKRSLEAVLNKAGNAISKAVFEGWDEIFGRKGPSGSLSISWGIDGPQPKRTGMKDPKTVAEQPPPVPPTSPPPQRVYLEFQIKDGDSSYLIGERSLGFRWFFCFLLFTHFRAFRRAQKNVLFLLDEPASNLHPKAQEQLLSCFERVTKKSGRIIYSTHSQHLINPRWLENVFIVRNRGIDHDSEATYYDFSSRDTDIAVEAYREFASKNPSKTTYFQPILDALNHCPSGLEAVPLAIFLEGKNDFYFIRYFELLLDRTAGRLPVVPGTGAGALDPLVAMYLGWGRPFALLLDDDAAGKRERNRYISEWILPESQVLTLGDISKAWSGKRFEEVILPTDQQTIAGGLKLPSKQDLARAIQENLILGKKVTLSTASMKQITELLEFLSAVESDLKKKLASR